MTAQDQQLYNIIKDLPDELYAKVIDYIEYLKFSQTLNDAPKDLTIKSDKDLLEKLQAGISETNKGNVYSIEEVYNDIQDILAN